MEKHLLVIPCCARKFPGGHPKTNNTTYFESAANVPNLIQARTNISKIHCVKNSNLFLPAWERYDGGMYRIIKQRQSEINYLIEKGVIDIVIVSALYGIINFDTEINDYDLTMSEGGLRNLWGCSVSEAILKYCSDKNINRVHLFLANSYKQVVTACNNHNNFIDHWVYGLRGINNITNEVGANFINLIDSFCEESNYNTAVISNQLQGDITFLEINKWLNEKLVDTEKINAVCNEIEDVPKNKGIYFWFIHPEGYKTLSKYLLLNSLGERYNRKIDGVDYDLVYVGSAGSRNNKNGNNSATLRDRLKWHLCDLKQYTNICNGTMSTFRRTIGALLNEDLISNNTQEYLDQVFQKYFKIYYLTYKGLFEEVIDQINKDEDILIRQLKPLFNIKNNPNAVDSTKLTYLIRERRRTIENVTKNIYCGRNDTKDVEQNTNPKLPPDIPKSNVVDSEPIYHGNCVSFKVKQNELIHAIAKNIRNLPIGPCSVTITNSYNKREFLYVTSKGGVKRIIRTQGRKVSEYFQAPDTGYEDGKQSKSSVVQKEMIEKNISEIVVEVCVLDKLNFGSN
jgi:hypothetical protein